MSRCTIDHSTEDVKQKLKEQQTFMPQELVERCELFLSKPLEQETLNEVFHLLKKYDLAAEEERVGRNQVMGKLFII
nr:group-specific protein [Sporosarcina obsidiansis]